MRGLKGKVAVVTGAAGGIGSAICRRFLEEEVRIVAIDLNADSLKQLAAGLGAGEDR
ncbi:MAG: SDR family NAD(P)-dependent oxidoreductase, partial [Bradyrhizobium sp.]|nr:SDR family NAD(P)-dependent oxidoreductase [Bradyrhizobium sp.]